MDQIDRAILLHDLIFGFDDHFSNPKVWIERLSQSNSKEGSFGGKIYFDPEGRGFLVMVWKNNRWHIWLAGVLPDHQRKNVFTQMVKQFLRDFGVDDQVLEMTVSTYPRKYPGMFHWIAKMQGKMIEISNDGKKCSFLLKFHCSM